MVDSCPNLNDSLPRPFAEVESEEDSQVVAINTGSARCRLGFAGEDGPRSAFASVVGRPRQRQPIDWDDMEKIWHHAFYNELHVEPAEEGVILTVAVRTPKANRSTGEYGVGRWRWRRSGVAGL
jgi:actin-related protein